MTISSTIAKVLIGGFLVGLSIANPIEVKPTPMKDTCQECEKCNTDLYVVFEVSKDDTQNEQMFDFIGNKLLGRACSAIELSNHTRVTLVPYPDQPNYGGILPLGTLNTTAALSDYLKKINSSMMSPPPNTAAPISILDALRRVLDDAENEKLRYQPVFQAVIVVAQSTADAASSFVKKVVRNLWNYTGQEVIAVSTGNSNISSMLLPDEMSLKLDLTSEAQMISAADDIIHFLKYEGSYSTCNATSTTH